MGRVLPLLWAALVLGYERSFARAFCDCASITGPPRCNDDGC